MTASILSSNDLCTEIVIKIEHDRSMADFEDKLQDSLNEAGRIGVQKELEWLDTDGSPIILGDIRLTSKSKKELKIYESPWGAVKVKRFVYQTSKGGAIFCPFDWFWSNRSSLQNTHKATDVQIRHEMERTRCINATDAQDASEI